jgi:hypothetical protein
LVPACRFAVDGLTETELSVGLSIVIVTGALLTVTPLRVAFTNSVSTPPAVPAVALTTEPVEAFRVASELVSDQEYAVPKGQGPPVHLGAGVNAWSPLLLRVAGEGLTKTEDNVFVVVMVMRTAELCWVTPFRVAFTKRATIPPADPAVNVTVEPVVGFTVPRALVTVHVKVDPDGQGPPEQTGVAVNPWLPPVPSMA